MKLLMAAVLATVSAGMVQASDPVALYGLIDRVTIEPSADKPERVRITGVFVLAKPNNNGDYGDPQRGYLYFRLPAGMAELARKEWADLASLAGRKQVIGLGARDWHSADKARVRNASEQPTNPDVYDFGTGVIKLRSDTDYKPVKALLGFK